jgi:xanthine dehydrogenase accessory factor
MNNKTLYSKITQLQEQNSPFVLTTVVSNKGSAPGKTGFKMLVEADGKITGTVGGGAIEKYVIEESLKRIQSGESGLQEYNLSEKAKPQNNAIVIPMSCSGQVSIFYDVSGQKQTVYIFGGGHVGHALLYHLKPLDYHSILIDNRNEFANLSTNPDASEVICTNYESYASEFQPPKGAMVVILTHGHKYDSRILNILYKRQLNLSYIGVIASKSKAAGLLRNLREQVDEDVDTSKVYTPIGLKIGGSSASEIGLAIAAEIQTIRYDKTLIEGDKIQS